VIAKLNLIGYSLFDSIDVNRKIIIVEFSKRALGRKIMDIQNTDMPLLDFEKQIMEIESKVEGLRNLVDADGLNIAEEIERLQSKLEKQIKATYTKLSPWQKTQVARHPNRPHCLDYIAELITDFTPLAGDRCFANDEAMIGGIGRFNGRSVVVMGQEKGNNIETRVKHNFGMAKPEGYRKAKRLMELAEKFNMPIISFVDTAGAYPGIDAEERGQAEAIAKSTEACLAVTVPFISCIIGEGGSGGAIAIAAANSVLMLEHSIYSVISPEGCASILWRSPAEVKTATEALCLTAQNLEEFKVIDEIIPEPLGGAHRSPKEAMASVGEVISKHLDRLVQMKRGELRETRREKFIAMGRFEN